MTVERTTNKGTLRYPITLTPEQKSFLQKHIVKQDDLFENDYLVSGGSEDRGLWDLGPIILNKIDVFSEKEMIDRLYYQYGVLPDSGRAAVLFTLAFTDTIVESVRNGIEDYRADYVLIGTPDPGKALNLRA